VTGGFTSVVLATGASTSLGIPVDTSTMYNWSATTGRVLIASEGTGFQMFDITSGQAQPVPIGAIQTHGSLGDIALSHDGTTVAVLTGPVDSGNKLTIYDIATGNVVFETDTPFPAEGSELSYDGTTVAVGNWYDSYGPVQVIDVASGASHTIDAHGVIL
jgi:hypothetical protein